VLEKKWWVVTCKARVGLIIATMNLKMKKAKSLVVILVFALFSILTGCSHGPETKKKQQLKFLIKAADLLHQADVYRDKKEYKKAIDTYKEYLDLYENKLKHIKREELPTNYVQYPIGDRIENLFIPLNVHWQVKIKITECEIEMLNPKTIVDWLTISKKYGKEEWLISNKLPEKYEPKIFFKIKSESDNGQTGIYMMEVDRNNNIYIFDRYNWKVLVFTDKGEYKETIVLRQVPKEIIDYYNEDFYDEIRGEGDDMPSDIRVDLEGNISIFFWGRSDIIYRFSPKGELKKVFVRPYYFQHCLMKSTYAPFFYKYFDQLEKQGKLLKSNYLDWKDLIPSRYILVGGYTDDGGCPFLSYNLSNRNVKFYIFVDLGIEGLLPDKIEVVIKNKSEKIKYAIIKADGNDEILATYIIDNKNCCYFWPLVEDVNGNMFIYGWSRGENYYKDWIYKYNLNGELVSMIEVKGIPFIDWQGNIYKIGRDAETNEYYVVKWEKTK